MGAVWCKSDRGQTRSFDSRGPFNSVLSRWTDHMRQHVSKHRKPKTMHRPPRPPKKPLRANERLTISHPQLVVDQSSDGWRSATLLVPEAPVPPPRKKRRRHQELTRTAYSMDDLDRVGALGTTTTSLQERYHSETGLDGKGSSTTTLVVNSVLESRLDPPQGLVTEHEEDKENMSANVGKTIEEEDEDDIEEVDLIIPIEKETLYSSRTILQSNLGYIDKLSAISEVSAESGFDDRIDVCKGSERSESAASTDSDMMTQINNLHNTAPVDVREKTALSKKEWLQSILREDAEPYFLPREPFKGSQSSTDDRAVDTARPDPSAGGHLHLMNKETAEADNNESKTSAAPPPSLDGHSVLLCLLQDDSQARQEIFLTNTKTNIIYKSLSSDKLADVYDNNYQSVEEKTPTRLEGGLQDYISNPFRDTSHPSDYSAQAAKLAGTHPGLDSLPQETTTNLVSSFEFKQITPSDKFVPPLTDAQPPAEVRDCKSNVVVNGALTSINITDELKTDCNDGDLKHVVKCSQTSKDSAPSSRRSSLSESLHEFEMSIYDMLRESKLSRDSSDEEDSLKTVIKKEKKIDIAT